MAEQTPPNPEPSALQPGMHVQPGAPVTSLVGTATAQKGQQFVLLRLETVHGTQMFFLDPAHARSLAANLNDNASLAASGLIVPDVVPKDLQLANGKG